MKAGINAAEGIFSLFSLLWQKPRRNSRKSAPFLFAVSRARSVFAFNTANEMLSFVKFCAHCSFQVLASFHRLFFRSNENRDSVSPRLSLSKVCFAKDFRVAAFPLSRFSFPTNFTLQLHVPINRLPPRASPSVPAASLVLPLSMLRCASPFLISLMPSAWLSRAWLKNVLCAYPSAKLTPFSVIPFAVNIHTIHSIGFCKYSLIFHLLHLFFRLTNRNVLKNGVTGVTGVTTNRINNLRVTPLMLQGVTGVTKSALRNTCYTIFACHFGVTILVFGYK
jgi:hypothetical protein